MDTRSGFDDVDGWGLAACYTGNGLGLAKGRVLMSRTSYAQRRRSSSLSGTRVYILIATTLALAFLTFSGSALASSSPSIDSVSVSGVTEHDATLEAQIDPGSLETTYEFHLSSPACQSHWPVIGPCFTVEELSLPSGSIAAASGDQTVRLDINSAGVTLEPGRWYEYSVTAHNTAGEAPAGGASERTQHSFKTLTAPGKPLVDSVSVSGVTEHDATLEAEIDPGSLETTYEFHLSSPACQSHWPVIGPCFTVEELSLPSGSIAAASGDQTVRLDINSAGVTLEPGRWYEYSVTAHNIAGEAPAVGGEQSFKTLSPDGGSPEPQYKTEPSSEAITLGNTLTNAAPQGEAARTQPVAPLITTSPADNTTTKARTAASLTRAQNLAKALKICDKKRKKLRMGCQRRAQKAYGTSGKQASRKRHKS